MCVQATLNRISCHNKHCNTEQLYSQLCLLNIECDSFVMCFYTNFSSRKTVFLEYYLLASVSRKYFVMEGLQKVKMSYEGYHIPYLLFYF